MAVLKHTRRRTPPAKNELASILKTKTNREAADYFGVGYKTFVRWLRDKGMVFDTSEMMNLSDAARILKVSRMTLSNWYRHGQIPGATKINETRVMVPRATVSMLVLLHGRKYDNWDSK